jgi:excisionase family DNA binding protein
MPYTLGEAAKATGKSKPTIQRAIKNGTISAARNEDGSYTIDPAELHRVFPPVTPLAGNDTGDMKRSVTPGDTPLLQAELAVAREKLAALEQERQRERHQLEATIDDLRRRLDSEAEERRRLTALLTDQRQGSNTPEPASAPPGKPVEGRLARAWSILRGKA